MRVVRRKPDISATRWMGCPRVTATYSNEVYDDDDYNDDEQQYKESTTAAAMRPAISFLPIIVLVFTSKLFYTN